MRFKAWNLQQLRIPRKLPLGVMVESKVEYQGQPDPYDAPQSGLSKRNAVSFPMENPEIQSQQHQYEADEEEVKPPVVRKWEIDHRNQSFSSLVRNSTG